ncbi:hypothetical protein POTOM_036436 [Populus tomentosa]|uniref:Uncharacterized protein n=2 Tax=Populus TaxID=3689 RepID=A0A4U5MWY1_POPAL|nr:hypothetical protein POTOM_036436 [Populus tomentosa]TKR74420.1 hypothetical protein D5086_0000294530 [Populus alba]
MIASSGFGGEMSIKPRRKGHESRLGDKTELEVQRREEISRAASIAGCLTALIWTAYLLGNFTHRYISHVDSTLDFLAFMFRHIFPVAKDPSVLSSQDFDAFSNYKSNGKTSLALSDSLNTSPSLAFLALYDVV